MGLSVREAQEKISPDEFRGWLAFDRIEPIGLERFDVLFAILASTFANCHLGKGQSAYKLKDFLPNWGSKQDPEDSTKKMIAIMDQMASKINLAFKK